jgi:hypothetical protein
MTVWRGKPDFVSFLLVSGFGSSDLFKRGERLAPFHDRGRSGVVCPTRRPWRPISAQGNLTSTDRGTCARGRGPRGKRQADRSDVRQKFARFETARSGSSLDKRTGASPSCREYLTIPAFDNYPFRFAHAMLNAAAFRRAPDNAFHPVTESSCLGSERLQRNCDNIVKYG